DELAEPVERGWDDVWVVDRIGCDSHLSERAGEASRSLGLARRALEFIHGGGDSVLRPARDSRAPFGVLRGQRAGGFWGLHSGLQVFDGGLLQVPRRRRVLIVSVALR